MFQRSLSSLKAFGGAVVRRTNRVAVVAAVLAGGILAAGVPTYATGETMTYTAPTGLIAVDDMVTSIGSGLFTNLSKVMIFSLAILFMWMFWSLLTRAARRKHG